MTNKCARKAREELHVSLAYEHDGPEADFPLRLRIGLGRGFSLGGKSSLDFLVRNSSELVNSEFPVAIDESGRTFGIFEGYLAEGFPRIEEGNDNVPPCKKSLVLNVCCSIIGEYGKPMWRDGGTCHFLLPECILNGEKDSHLAGPTSYVFKTVTKSAYGVANEDRLTGRAGLVARTNAETCSLPPFPAAPVVAFLEPNGLRVSSCSARRAQVGKTETLRRDVDAHFCEYRQVLKRQDELVPRDKKTANMRCPWTPMDACVWELFENEYGVGDDGRPVGARDSLILTKSTKSPEKDRERERPSTLTRFANAVLSACGSKQSEESASSLRTSQWGDIATRPENRVYLPFFAYCITRPLVVCRSHWTRALEIYALRKGMPVLEAYATYFFGLALPERAAEAAGMISMYAQALEYVSDFVLPKTAEIHSEGEGDGRKEVEQFWDALIALCGDCDDLTLAHLQMYKAFVMDSWKDEVTNGTIRSNPVLKSMRALLANNYIPLFNIEAVYLPKQSSSGSASRETTMRENPFRLSADGLRPEKPKDSFFHASGYLGFSTKFADGHYETDAGSVNSAHAALKLFPKKYFERCVNRAYATKGAVGAFPSLPPGKSGAKCCFYHAHPPDHANDDLPVLFLEGTSMLFCYDGKEDPCPAKIFSETFFDDPLLGEVGKFPIYARRAESAFYGSSLFGSALEFLGKHGIATFSYARANKKPKGAGESNSPSFLRGVSHRQLSLKSESAMLVPYGADFSREPVALAKTFDSADPCTSIDFRSREVSEFMLHLCYEECKNRPAPRKVKAPGKKPKTGQARREKEKADEKTARLIFDPNAHEDRRSVHHNGKLLRTWCEAANRDFLESPSKFPALSPKGFFCYYVNNYYVDEDFVQKLSSVHATAVARECASGSANPFAFKVQAELEEHSSDVKLWRVRWEFY